MLSLVTCGILISVIISFFIKPIIEFLGGGGDLFPYVKEYLSMVIMFCVCYMTGYALEIYIKVDGNPGYPTFCVISGGIINIVLDYVFVVVFHWGIRGAAFATGLSQLTSMILLLGYILLRAKHIKFIKIKFKLVEIIKNVFSFMKTGFAEFLAEISMGISIFVFNLIVLKRVGDIGVSAFGIIGYITSFITMTMIGFNQGTQPILSFNLGAKNYLKIKKMLKISFIILTCIQVFFYLLINIANHGIVSIFLKDTTAISLTTNALKLYSFAYLICGFNIFTAGYFTAMNRVKISTGITLLRGIILLILFLNILPGILGSNGIWLSVPATELVTLIVSFLVLKKYNPLKEK